MAKSPPESGDPSHRNRNWPSPLDSATFVVEIALTASARLHAGRQEGLSAALSALRLPAGCAQGDLVTLETAGARHDFLVLMRRWVASGDGLRLEVTLDHPARPVGR
ncbi:hypothetical protein [Aquamicrobium terrae]